MKPNMDEINSDLEASPEEEGMDYNDGLHSAAKALLNAIKMGNSEAVAEALKTAVSLCHEEPDGDEEPMPEKGKGLLIIAGKPGKE